MKRIGQPYRNCGRIAIEIAIFCTYDRAWDSTRTIEIIPILLEKNNLSCVRAKAFCFVSETTPSRTTNLLICRFKRTLLPDMSQFAARWRRDVHQIMTVSKHDEMLNVLCDSNCISLNYPLSRRRSYCSLYSRISPFYLPFDKLVSFSEKKFEVSLLWNLITFYF